VLLPEIERQQRSGEQAVFCAAAFAKPELYAALNVQYPLSCIDVQYPILYIGTRAA
jgi:hypothetical protein